MHRPAWITRISLEQFFSKFYFIFNNNRNLLFSHFLINFYRLEFGNNFYNSSFFFFFQFLMRYCDLQIIHIFVQLSFLFYFIHSGIHFCFSNFVFMKFFIIHTPLLEIQITFTRASCNVYAHISPPPPPKAYIYKSLDKQQKNENSFYRPYLNSSSMSNKRPTTSSRMYTRILA